MSVQRNKTLYQHIFPSQGYIFSLLFQRAQSRTFSVRKEGWYLPLLNWLRHQKGFWPYRQLFQSMESTIIEPGLKFWGSQANQLNLHLKMWGKTSSSCLYFSGTYTVKKGYQLIMETLIKIQTTIQTKGKLGNTSGMLAPKEGIQQAIGRGFTNMITLTKVDTEAPYNLERFNPRRRHQSLERCRKINRLHCSQWFANGSYWKMG